MNVLCYGASGHGRVVADILQCAGIPVLGFIDDGPDRRGETFAGLPVFGGADALKKFPPETSAVVVTIGTNSARGEVARRVRSLGFRLVAAVHPRAAVASGVAVGAGTVIMAGAVVNPGTTIGENVIVNTGATIDHDCRIGNGAHVSPGAHLAGAVSVGAGAHIGIGACVIPGCSIGENAIVGAGAVVLRDVPSGATVVGNPARLLDRERERRHGVS